MQNSLKMIFYIVIMISVLVYFLVGRIVKNRFAKILSEITLAGLVSAVSYGLFMLFSTYMWAFLAVTVYCVAIDWVVYFVFVYVLILTESGSRLRACRMPLKILFFLDTFDLLLNLHFHHRFDLVPASAGMTLKHFEGVYSQWNQLGNAMSFAVTFFTLAILVYHIVRADRFVRKRYLFVFCGYVTVLLLNLCCVIWNVTIDYSIMFYFPAALILWYGTLEVFPKQLVRDANELLLQNIKLMVMYFDQKGHCLLANKQAEELLEMSAQTGYGEAENIFARWFQTESGTGSTAANDSRSLQEAMNESEDRARITQLDVGGKRYFVRYFMWSLQDRKKRPVGHCLIMEDYTKEYNTGREVQYKAFHDELTNVLHREGFLQTGKAFLKKRAESMRERETYHLISVNISNFKRINTNFSTKEGDRLLRILADSISLAVNGKSVSAMPAGDMFVQEEDSVLSESEMPIGRMGGDRFAFLLSTVQNEQTVIRQITLETVKAFDKPNYRLELLFGICPIDLQTADSRKELNLFYDNAVRAASSIRPGGESNFAYYDDELIQTIEEETRLQEEFREALEAHQFVIYIQPQCGIDNRSEGGEALVRWNHPRYKDGLMYPLLPGAFLDPLRKKGLVHELDKYVWEEAVKLLRKWADAGKENFYLSVNIEPSDFDHMDVYEVICALTDRYGVARNRLRLEITEATMANEEKIIETIAALQAAGFEIEIDDFGSEYSSLNRLKTMPADVLKMDMKFFETCPTQNGSADMSGEIVRREKAITNVILKLGEALGMKVIAEGVETMELAQDLSEAGCQVFQGWGFDRPMPVEEFEKKRMHLEPTEN